uniref:Uncharacterized protein n=1 Tax=Arundo donax TaxID=35708 RepID=A0A0A9CDT7_ARUDO
MKVLRACTHRKKNLLHKQNKLKTRVKIVLCAQ